MGDLEISVVPTGEVGGENEQLRRELLMKIGQRCIELTANTQTDIEPTDLLRTKSYGSFDEREYRRQLTNPKLPQGIQIKGAVLLRRRNLGLTSFVLLRDKKGNVAGVRLNEGTTDTASLTRGVEVAEGHRELVVDVARQRGKEYFTEQIVIGGVPGVGMDMRISRGLQVRYRNPKSFDWMRKNFDVNRALSDMPPLATESDETRGKLNNQDLLAILDILETGTVDVKGMVRAIVRKGDLLLTTQEYNDRLAKSD